MRSGICCRESGCDVLKILPCLSTWNPDDGVCVQGAGIAMRDLLWLLHAINAAVGVVDIRIQSSGKVSGLAVSSWSWEGM